MRAEDVDGIPVLARATALRRDVVDAIVDDLRAVVARRRAPHLNAVVGRITDGVAGDDEATRIERMDGCAQRAGDRGGGDLTFDSFEYNSIAARAQHFAIADRDSAAIGELDQAAVLGQRLAAAVEGDA